ncbi:hypothetical protein [Tomitella biformata]|uniref:hypothetical protein n=1 Tax=Tomitella biformata TaxID=630403 RepID=UPI0004BB515C|nr:hypothetical protein [Tomitella biformata]
MRFGYPQELALSGDEPQEDFSGQRPAEERGSEDTFSGELHRDVIRTLCAARVVR